ncbi:flagellar protein FlaG [Viridibacillus sp. YIM B01967]|uniref:Flagellar protein FlaG n=1 Tax=Viridibacillus soli TaxID=2798301 RepID=A0ABS1H6C3_9BACL|nr:flagellar protein FlaG [Viridibacillus soli]MBK3494849.1 flagellar protein FlaG [Viridibacillus soli]
MRISPQAPIENVTTTVVPQDKSSTVKVNDMDMLIKVQQQSHQDEQPTKETLERAINALNEFMEFHNKNSKFVLHDGLNRYFVQVVDTKTEEVVREIPPKKLLDAYYTMQKYLGKVVDETI